MTALAASSDREANEIALLHQLSARIFDAARYRPGATTATTNAEEALLLGQGVCQDHAHIFIAAARALGFASRYVSGYLLLTDRPAQDAGHAWAETHVAGIGWIGFDVSNQVCPDARYVSVFRKLFTWSKLGERVLVALTLAPRGHARGRKSLRAASMADGGTNGGVVRHNPINQLITACGPQQTHRYGCTPHRPWRVGGAAPSRRPSRKPRSEHEHSPPRSKRPRSSIRAQARPRSTRSPFFS